MPPRVRLRSAARALRGAQKLAGAGTAARKYRLGAGEAPPDRPAQNSSKHKAQRAPGCQHEADAETALAAQRSHDSNSQAQRVQTAVDRDKEAALAVLAADWRERGLLLSAKNTEVVSVQQLLEPQRSTLPWISEGGWLSEARANALLWIFAQQEVHDGHWRQQQQRQRQSNQLSEELDAEEAAAVAAQERLASLGGALSAFGTASVTTLVDIVEDLQLEVEDLMAEDENSDAQLGAAARRLARAQRVSGAKALATEQKIERELQVRRHVIQTALLALRYLLRLCAESTRRQMHLSLPELENEIYRLDSTANYDANGDGVGATLLHVAAEDGNAELMGEVLRKEHGVDTKRLDGTTPLYAAARLGQADAVRWLLVNGADVNLARRDGCTPILAAAAAGNMGMLRQLCMAGANLMQTERSGISALVIVAARVEHKRLIKKKVGLESREKYRAAFQNYEDNERGDVEALHELADSLRDKINHSMMELEAAEPPFRAVLSMATVAELYRRAALKEWNEVVAIRAQRSTHAKLSTDEAGAIDDTPLSPTQHEQDAIAAAAGPTTDGPSGSERDLLGPADLCKVLRRWGVFHMNKPDAQTLAAQLVSPGAGAGVPRAGFEQTFWWWWQWDRTSTAQREATSMSNGPGTGSLPPTEQEVNSQAQRRAGGARKGRSAALVRLSPRLVADTSSVVAYYDAQRWIVQACAGSLRSVGRYPSAVAVLERIRRKAVLKRDEAKEEMRHTQKRFRDSIPSGSVPELPELKPIAAGDETRGRCDQAKKHRRHTRLVATAMQHKAAAAFKEGTKSFALPAIH